MAAQGKRVITLESSDGEVFEVEEIIALESETIKHMIKDNSADSAIPLPSIKARTLSKVIEYCRKHVEAAADPDGISSEANAADEQLKAWNDDFLNINQSDLFDLILAADYLNLKRLLLLTCQAVANMMKDKSPEEIRSTFNLVNDLTPEEERDFRRKFSWAFE